MPESYNYDGNPNLRSGPSFDFLDDVLLAPYDAALGRKEKKYNAFLKSFITLLNANGYTVVDQSNKNSLPQYRDSSFDICYNRRLLFHFGDEGFFCRVRIYLDDEVPAGTRWCDAKEKDRETRVRNKKDLIKLFTDLQEEYLRNRELSYILDDLLRIANEIRVK